MSGPPPPTGAGGAGHPPSESWLAERLLRRLGPPGLIDSAAAQDAVRRRLERSSRLFPLVERLLARAAEDGARELSEAAMPLAARSGPGATDTGIASFGGSLGFGTGDPGAWIQGRAAEDPPRDLVRVARRGAMSETGLTRSMPEAGRPGAAPSTASSPFGLALPQPGSREAETAEPSGPIAQSASESRITGAGSTYRNAAPSLATIPRPPIIATSASLPRRTIETYGAAGNQAVQDGMGPPPTGTTGSPDLTLNRYAAAVSDASHVPQGAGDRPPAPAMPLAPATGAMRRALELGGPGDARAASHVPASEAASSPMASANAGPARPMFVSELRQPAVPRRTTVAPDDAPITRTRAIPELPQSARPQRPLVLRAPVTELPGRAAIPTPAGLQTGGPAAPVGVPLPPLPISRERVPPATAALAGAELERLADRVGRIIARRVAVERERRGH